MARVAVAALLLLMTCVSPALLSKPISEKQLDELLELVRQYRDNKGQSHNSNAAGKKAGSVTEKELEAWLNNTNEEMRQWAERSSLAYWDYLTNLTEENAHKPAEVSEQEYTWTVAKLKEAKPLLKNADSTWDASLLRQLKLFVYGRGVPLPDSAETQKKLSSLVADMEGIYGNAYITKDNNKDKQYRIEPELNNIMETSRNWDELLWAWKGWREVTGPLMRDKYTQLVTAMNQAAHDNGFKDVSESWRLADFEEDAELVTMVDTLFTQVKPLYEQLHTYVRAKLIEKYPDHGITDTGPIPAHILGDMWSQQWTAILDLVQPYPKSPAYDVTPALKKQGYTPHRMFELAQSFFTSIGLDKMTDIFWRLTMMERPADGRPVQCHGSAEDFSSKNCSDFRIKMCTSVNMADLQTVHHEMGHIQYFMQYCHQPQMFHSGANSAFHEAIGDTIALSVMTPNHLQAIGLLDSSDTAVDEAEKKRRDINFLMKAALEKVAFLPFGYLIDKWRWDVFSGKIIPANYNTKWWEYRQKYQGVAAPEKRSEKYFDPGAKFHVPSNVPYIRYFLSFIGQFQFHRALCQAAGHTGPLHTCDIYKSTKAGDLLKSVLQLGSSLPWEDAMEKMTGQRTFSADALYEYFDPLLTWLKEENKGRTVGWTVDS